MIKLPWGRKQAEPIAAGNRNAEPGDPVPAKRGDTALEKGNDAAMNAVLSALSDGTAAAPTPDRTPDPAPDQTPVQSPTSEPPVLHIVDSDHDAAPPAEATKAKAAARRVATPAAPKMPEKAVKPKASPRKKRPDLRAWKPLAPFLVATLSPVPLFLLISAFGGAWSLVALLWMTAVLFALDELAQRRLISVPDTADAAPDTLKRADRLSLLLAGLHFALLPFAVWVLAGGAGLGFFGWIAAFLAFGLWFGQVSNSNAHELIHRSDRWLFRAGMWVYISLLFGHHTSAHRLVHHRFVATGDDPNTAAAGESFYTFVSRAWPDAFVAGYEMETNRRDGRKVQRLDDLNPYFIYMGGAAAMGLTMAALFGLDGLLAYLLLCAHAQLQIHLSDYVQHYGLVRHELPSGALEPAGARHSWDAPHPVSALLMLNAPRHSDHHAHPSRPYPALRLSPRGKVPTLPYSLPVMATIALVPRAWHRIMDKRLAALNTGRAT